MTYRTEQRKIIEQFFEENSEKFFSVEDIEKYLNEKGESVGKTTVYRTLKTLEEKELVPLEQDETSSSTESSEETSE